MTPLSGATSDGSKAAELDYRKQIRPVVQDRATAMDRIFPAAEA